MTSHGCGAVLLALSFGLAPVVAGAEETSENHGYFGVGLDLISQNAQTPLGDFNSTGGGLMLNGAGILGTGGPVGFGITGEMGFGGRTDTDSDTSISEIVFGFDGGVLIGKVFYVSVGLHMLGQTPDTTDVTTTYTVVPLGLGALWGTDSGYVLAQLRFGGGQLSNDQTSDTEDIDYFGLRLAGQTGAADGLQFMGGMEFDTFDATSIDATDNFFRLFFGVGFGG